MKFKQQNELLTTLLISAAFSAAGLLSLFVFGLWHQIDYRSLDALRRTATHYGYAPSASSQICYLTISDQTYEAFNKGNLGRRKLAEANRILKEMGTEAVLYDLILARPTWPQADTEFAESLRENGRVFLPQDLRCGRLEIPEMRRIMPRKPDARFRSCLNFLRPRAEQVT